MNKLDFNFDFSVRESPKEIVERVFVDCINEASKGILKASLKSYSGHIRSYETTETLNALAEITRERKRYHDIQNELGEVKKKYFKYELIIESTVLNSYLYRVLFLQYGEECYPATVVVADAISRCLSLVELKNKGDESYIYTVNDPEGMEKMVNAILNTQPLKITMQQAITASMMANRTKELEDK